MASHGIRVCFDSLANTKHNLLTPCAGEIQYHLVTSTSSQRGTQFAIADPYGRPVKFSLLGVVDSLRSCLGPYGDICCTLPARTHRELLAARYTVDMTYPIIAPGDIDEDLTVGIVNQVYRLDEIQQQTLLSLRDKGCSARGRSWVSFEHNTFGPRAWMSVDLGNVFESADNPYKTIEDDYRDHPDVSGDQGLRRNTNIPCYSRAGEKIAPTRLQGALSDGFWVKAEVELRISVAGLTADYQLYAKRLEILDVVTPEFETLRDTIATPE